jgi:hypothetical protein
MTTSDHLSALFDCLISKDQIVVHDPRFWSDEGIIGQFIFMKRFLADDDPAQSLLLEARQVLYQKNSFIVSLDWLSLFLDDLLGNWEDIPVERLVQDVTVQVNGNDIYRGPALGCMPHLPRLTRELDVSRIPSEVYREGTATGEYWVQNLSDCSSPSTTHSSMDDSVASDDTWDTATLVSEVREDMPWDMNEDVQG